MVISQRVLDRILEELSELFVNGRSGQDVPQGLATPYRGSRMAIPTQPHPHPVPPTAPAQPTTPPVQPSPLRPPEPPPGKDFGHPAVSQSQSKLKLLVDLIEKHS